jgi:hypothetical protein
MTIAKLSRANTSLRETPDAVELTHKEARDTQHGLMGVGAEGASDSFRPRWSQWER